MGIVEMRFSFYLTEMAYHQDRAIEKIEDLLSQVITHLFKCLTMSESRDFNHWLKEIRNWISQMDDYSVVKPKNRRINLKVFLKEYEQKLSFKYLLRKYENVLYQYGLGCKKHIPTPEKCIEFVQGFLADLFETLSNDELSWVDLDKKLKDFK